jgi:hypothetical protein
MNLFLRGGLALVVLLITSPAFGEDEARRRAREELERQLNQMVERSPARVRVEFQPVDDPNFRVEELEVMLDGKPLKAPSQAAIAAWVEEGPMPVGVLDVSPGRHKVSSKMTVHNTASVLVSEEGDARWKIAGDVAFEVASGIEVKVVVKPLRDPSQKEVAKRLKLTFPSQPLMIARLEDGALPESPKLKVATAIDAGASKSLDSVDAAVAKPSAAEEKKRKAEEVAAAQRAAQEERKRKAEEVAAIKRAAAEEKQRKADEAAQAKRAAAIAKRAALEERQQKVAALVPAQGTSDAPARLTARSPNQEVGSSRLPEIEAAVGREGGADASPPAEAEREIEGSFADAGKGPLAEVGSTAQTESAPAKPDAGLAALDPPAPRSEPPWGLIVGGVSVAGVIAAFLLRKKRGE